MSSPKGRLPQFRPQRAASQPEDWHAARPEPSRQRSITDLHEELARHKKLRDGAALLLHAADSNRYDNYTKQKELRDEAQLRVNDMNRHITLLERTLEATKRLGLGDDRKTGSATPEDSTWALGDSLVQLSQRDISPHEYVAVGNSICTLLTHHPHLRHEIALATTTHRLQAMLVGLAPQVAAVLYRVARHAIVSAHSLRTLSAAGLQSLATLSLAKPCDSHAVERRQALRFARAFIDTPNGSEELQVGLVRAVVAVVEDHEDPLHKLALETVLELAVCEPEVLAAADGLRLVFSAVQEESSGALAAVHCMSRLVDSPLTRPLLGPLLPHTHPLLAPFTDPQPRGHINTERLQNAAHLLTSFLKRWSGVLQFVEHGAARVQVLVDTLRIQIPVLRDVVMDCMFEMLHLRRLPWLENVGPASVLPPALPLVLVILVALLQCNLPLQLHTIIEESEDELNLRKAALLVAEMHRLAFQVLPERVIPHLQRPPVVVTDNYDSRVLADYALEKMTRVIHRGKPFANVPATAETVMMGVAKAARAQRIANVDETELRAMIADTNVLTTKTVLRWNWGLLTEMCRGPLRNPRRFDEAIGTKLIRRLMSFFRPFKYRFLIQKRSKKTIVYERFGCDLFEMFLLHQEGIRFLSDSKVVPQLAECLAQVDPYLGITAADPLFLASRLDTTCARGYFGMLGVLLRHPAGVRILTEWRFWTMFYHVVERNGREDLIRLLLENLDLASMLHASVVFSKALQSCNVAVRTAATRELVQVLEQPVLAAHACHLLVVQLYDPDVEVAQLAASLLYQHCRRLLANTNVVIRCRPVVEHLGDWGVQLQMHFLTTAKGFQWMRLAGVVEREMARWDIDTANSRAMEYASMVDNYLTRETLQRLEVPPPPHFYGALALTAEGAGVLDDAQVVPRLAALIRRGGGDGSDAALQVVAAAVYAMAAIAGAVHGSMLVAEVDGFELVLEMAVSSPWYLLRGVALNAAGTMGATPEGAEFLDECGWSVAQLALGTPGLVSLPTDLTKLSPKPDSMPPRTHEPLWLLADEVGLWEASDGSQDELRALVLGKFRRLGGIHLLFERPLMRLLKTMAERHPEVFALPDLLASTLRMLATGRYRQETRRYVLGFFKDLGAVEELARRDRRVRVR